MSGFVENHGHSSSLGIGRVDSPLLLGGVDLRAPENEQLNLSYVVFPQFRRNGTAQKACELALNYASNSMGARIALIKMLVGNVSSLNLALNLGAHYLREEPLDAGGTFQVLGVKLPLPFSWPSAAPRQAIIQVIHASPGSGTSGR